MVMSGIGMDMLGESMEPIIFLPQALMVGRGLILESNYIQLHILHL